MIAREAEIEMEMACRGLDRDEAELVVDARLARELAAGAQAENEAIVKGVVDSPGPLPRRPLPRASSPMRRRDA